MQNLQDKMKPLGRKIWLIPGGYIPMHSNGREPDFVSQDRIAVLNTAENPVVITVTVFYNNKEPIGPYNINIGGKRLRKIRINDLIDPFPVFLGKQYSLLIKSDTEVVVQYLQMNTSAAEIAYMGTMGFGTD